MKKKELKSKKSKFSVKIKKIKLPQIKIKEIKPQDIKIDESKLEEVIEEADGDNQFHDSFNLSLSTGSFSSLLSKVSIPQQQTNFEEDAEINTTSTARAESTGIRRDYAPSPNAPDYASAVLTSEQKFREYENIIEPTTLTPLNNNQNIREQELLDRNWQMRNAQRNNWSEDERIFPESIGSENILPFEDRLRKYKKVKI